MADEIRIPLEFDDSRLAEQMRQIEAALKKLGVEANNLEKNLNEVGGKGGKGGLSNFNKSISGVTGGLKKALPFVAKFGLAAAGAVAGVTTAMIGLAQSNNRVQDKFKGTQKELLNIKDAVSAKLAPIMYVFWDRVTKGIQGFADKITETSDGPIVKFASVIGGLAAAVPKFLEAWSKNLTKVKLEWQEIIAYAVQYATAAFSPGASAAYATQRKIISAELDKTKKDLDKLLLETKTAYKDGYEATNKEITDLIEKGYFQTKEGAKDLTKDLEDLDKLIAEFEAGADRAFLESLSPEERLEEIFKRQTEKNTEDYLKIVEEAKRLGKLTPELEKSLFDDLTEQNSQAAATFENSLRKLRKEARVLVEPVSLLEKGKLPSAYVREAAMFAQQLEDEMVAAYSAQDRTFFENIKNDVLVSLGINEEEANLLLDGFTNVFNAWQNAQAQATQQALDQNQELINSIRERTDTVEEELDRELKYAELGYANNVEAKRKELEALKEEEAKAQAEREALQEKAYKQQRARELLSQAGSLATAAANILSAETKSKGILGVALALAGIAFMFSVFSKAKKNAEKEARAYKGGPLADYGFVNEKGRSDIPGRGRGHRVEDSNLVLGGGEFVNSEAISRENKAFLQKLNEGKYRGMDLEGILDSHVDLTKANQGIQKRNEQIALYEIQNSERMTVLAIKQGFSEHLAGMKKLQDDRKEVIPIKKDDTGYIERAKGFTRIVRFNQ